MRRVVASFLTAFIAVIIVGCGGSSDPGDITIKKIKNGKLIADFPANILKSKLLQDKIIDSNQTVFGFKAYKIPYKTKDANGNDVNASGVMVVPSALGCDKNTTKKLATMKQLGLAAVVDCHGTIFANKEAPSVEMEATSEPAGAAVILSSISGFITLQPDYIGFGDSKGHLQEYLIEKSSSSEVVDFIKAAKRFAKENNIKWIANNQMYLTGYSQGGFVALAALEDMEKEKFNLRVAAPMAGPYLLDPIAQGVLSSETIDVPSFMAATANSYANVYNKNIKSLIQEPYASKLPTLFDGSKTRVEIDKELTTKVKGDDGLFSDTLISTYDLSWFRLELFKNSVVDFSPKTPVKLLHCLGDDVIPYKISEASRDIFNGLLNASYVDLTPVEVAITKNPETKLRLTHAKCGIYAYGVAAHIFAQDRKNSIGY
jgi:alpha/beta superfamily hydrolase